ncbi:MAG: DUF3606 domain-containing protein, partial [Mesorhizobium sp.]
MGPAIEPPGTTTARIRSPQAHRRNSWRGVSTTLIQPVSNRHSDPVLGFARRKEMADNKCNRDLLDHDRLSVDEYYEVEHFARENGVSPSQVSK